mmetsp:Transcript_7095/g.13107  ORF Transcript_7095/g.13107 Transcript_7095/m.13107 type:complete len:356 (-) Transcript_7095:256-1323(-)
MAAQSYSTVEGSPAKEEHQSPSRGRPSAPASDQERDLSPAAREVLEAALPQRPNLAQRAEDDLADAVESEPLKTTRLDKKELEKDTQSNTSQSPLKGVVTRGRSAERSAKQRRLRSKTPAPRRSKSRCTGPKVLKASKTSDTDGPFIIHVDTEETRGFGGLLTFVFLVGCYLLSSGSLHRLFSDSMVETFVNTTLELSILDSDGLASAEAPPLALSVLPKFGVADATVERIAAEEDLSIWGRALQYVRDVSGIDYTSRYSIASAQALTSPGTDSCWSIPCNFQGRVRLVPDVSLGCHTKIARTVRVQHNKAFAAPFSASVRQQSQGGCITSYILTVTSLENGGRCGTCVNSVYIT